MNYFIAFIFLFSVTAAASKPFTIMLDPAGDAKYAGRTIGDYFERGITLSMTNALKQELEKRFSNVRIILTRLAGETLEPLQNANFANRLDVDFYLNIHFFCQIAEMQPILYVYYMLRNSVTDHWQRTNNDTLSFISVLDAHKMSLKLTEQFAQKFIQGLRTYSTAQSVIIKGPYGLPFKPLMGITAPSLALEIGLRTNHEWKLYIELIANALEPILHENMYAQK